jgi:ABC-type antimicrobial peptide transport system permease subunit
MVAGYDLALVLGGLVIGLPIAVASSRVATALFYQVDGWDPATLLITAALMLFIGVVAAIVPVRRALAVEPGTAVRGG